MKPRDCVQLVLNREDPDQYPFSWAFEFEGKDLQA
jgi:hypothetical protein